MEEGESEIVRMDIGEGEDSQTDSYIDQDHNMDSLVDGTSGLVSDIGKEHDQNSDSESSTGDDRGSESDMFDSLLLILGFFCPLLTNWPKLTDRNRFILKGKYRNFL